MPLNATLAGCTEHCRNLLKIAVVKTTDMSPLISILMPVYNAGLYLEACLQSVLAQTCTHWELVAVDDGSEDNSLAILEQFARSDSRIRVQRHSERQGISPALRLAFAQSTGELITRMDADDAMASQKLERLSTLLKSVGRGHVATGMVSYFSENTVGDGYRQYQDWLNGLMRTNQHYEDIYKECVLPSPCWMVFREDLLNCGAFESETYPEDYDLCFRFYKKGLKVVAVQEVLHFWRDHAGRTSRNAAAYANQSYFDLKLPYYLELDYDAERPLVLWGAGKKGKQIASRLFEQGVPFHWVCDNSAKWGVVLHGTTLKDYHRILEMERPQIIILVSAPEGKTEILRFLQKHTFKAAADYFFFC